MLHLRHLLAALLAVGATAASGGPRVGNEGEQCAGLIGTVCAEGLWCELASDQCRAADGAGACRRVVEICTREFRPVSGCDGTTYPNDCERRRARVGLLHDGAC